MYFKMYFKFCFKAVDLLPPMSPLSFDPASEEVYAKSILLQYPASLPGLLFFSFTFPLH